jgi:hypothetical protein
VASCNSHCSTGATWPPSHRPIFPANDWWYAAIPDLAAERARKREELLAATEKALGGITIAVERKRRLLRGTTEIALAVSAVLNTYKMKKHFDLIITDDAFSFARRTAEIVGEAATTGSMSSAPVCPKRHVMTLIQYGTQIPGPGGA